MTCYGAWKAFGHWFLLALCLYVAYYAATHREELAITRWEDYINPLKWGSVVYATFMKFLFPIHIIEQLVLRMYDKECRECVKNGSCLSCGCDISKVYTPWDRCSEGNWGPMVEDPDAYAKIRDEFPVEITIRYPKEEGKVRFVNINDKPERMTWADYIESLKSEWDKDTL